MRRLSLLPVVLLLCTSLNAQSRLDRLVAEAIDHLDRQQPDSAVAKAEEALAIDPLSVDAARIVQDVKRPPKQYYGGLLAADPDVPMYNYLYARTLRNERKPDSMEYYLRRSITLDRGFYWGYIGLASSRVFSAAKVPDALELLRVADSLRPASKPARNMRVLASIALNQPAAVLTDLYQMIREEPTTAMLGHLERAYLIILKHDSLHAAPDESFLAALADSAVALRTTTTRPVGVLQQLLASDSLYSAILVRIQEGILRQEAKIRATHETEYRDRTRERASHRPGAITREASKIIKEVRAAYRKLKTMYCVEDVSTIGILKDKPPTIRSTARTTAFLRPGRYRTEIRNQNGGLIQFAAADQKNVWRTSPSRKQYIRTPFIRTSAEASVDSVPSIKSAMEFGQHWIGAVRVREEVLQIGPRSLTCDVLFANESTGQTMGDRKVDTDRYTWIDKKTHMIIKDSLHGIFLNPKNPLWESTQVSTVRELRINEELSDALFQFAPPEGWSEVEEFATPPPEGMVGSPAPPITLNDLQGTMHTLAGYLGKVVLIDFWATWCGPCRVELPRVQKLYNELRGKGLIVLGISNEKKELPEKYFKENNYTFPSLIDEGGAVSKKYRVTVIPSVVVIDKQGKIASYIIGVRSEDFLRKTIMDAGL